ncbi:hypothetical protein ACQP2X_11220 [Actinoplanes sp. CA-131856]
MLISTARGILTSMLDDAGVRPGSASVGDVRTTLEVFRRFAEIPVEDAGQPDDDGDGIVAQYGTYDFRGRREFSAGLTRQLVEEPSTWQLSCTFHWSPSAGTEALASGHVWSFGKTLDEFFTEAVALPGWAWATAGTRAPRDLEIVLDEI